MTKLNNYKIEEISVDDLHEIMNLRFNSKFLRENSFFSNLGKDFTTKIFRLLIKSKTCISKKITFYEGDTSYIDGYSIFSKDILLTSFELGVKLFFYFLTEYIKKDPKNKKSSIRDIYYIFKVYFYYIFSYNFFKRACFIELCQKENSKNFFSPGIMLKNVERELKKLNISTLKFSYYENNPAIFNFLEKFTHIINWSLENVAKINLKPNNIIIAIYLSKNGKIKEDN